MNEICAICLMDPEHGSTIPELNGACTHIYCQKCIVLYIKKLKEMGCKISCPLCRKVARTPVPN